MNMYTVYMHTNKTNGKKYVGATRLSVARRSNNGKGYSQQKRFFDDILLYGWDNFTHEILYSGLTRERAAEVERAMVKKYDTTNPQKGYNSNKGGEIPTEQARSRMSERKHDHPVKTCRPVFCFDNCRMYRSIKEAAEDNGMTKQTVWASAHNRGKEVRGKVFIYWDNIPEELQEVLSGAAEIITPREMERFGD